MYSKQQTILKLRRFTLMELLVVVAIIGILASMLLPVLGKARTASKTSVCLGNQRQIGTSFALFLDDHDQALPPVSFEWPLLAPELDPDLSHQMSMWDNLIATYMQIPLRRNQIRVYGVDSSDVTNTATGSFSCPLDNIDRENTDLIPRTYSVVLGVLDWNGSTKVSDIASDSILMTERPFSRNYFGSNGAPSTRSPSEQSSGGVFGLHGNNKWNYLYIDGSASTKHANSELGNGDPNNPEGSWTKTSGD